MEFPGVPIFPGYGKQKNAITRYWGDGVSRFHPISVNSGQFGVSSAFISLSYLKLCCTLIVAYNGATRIVLLVT